MLNKFLTNSSTLFGVGHLPKAPGTWGSLVSVLFVYLLSFTSAFPHLWLILVGGFLYGVYSSGIAEKTYGHDAGCIVIDEFFGQLIPFLFLSQVAMWQMLVGFVLFRFFDIAKPLGIRKIQDLPKGWGVMTDDIVAGVYSLVVLQVIGFIATKI